MAAVYYPCHTFWIYIMDNVLPVHPAAAPVPSASPPSPHSSALPGTLELMGETWRLLRRRKVLIGIAALAALSPFAIGLVGGFIVGFFAVLFGLYENTFIMGVLQAVLIFVSLFVSFWSGAALLYATAGSGEHIGAGEAYRRASKRLLSLFWIAIMTSFVVIGGLGLLIVPGILFAIWFSFSNFVLVVEDKRGLTALLTSKEYVRGLFWQISGRYALFGLICTAIYLAIFFAIFAPAIFFVLADPSLFWLSDVIQILISVLITIIGAPLMTAFMYVLYASVKAHKGVVTVAPPWGQKTLYTAVGIFGVVCTLAVAVFLYTVAQELATQDERAGQSETVTEMQWYT